jgi:signal transduction histidine kinase
MRLRIVAVVVATTSLVLVSFLLPFALVLRTLAADHATSNAMVEAQSVAALVTAMSDRELRLAVAQVNAASNASVTVFLPDGAQAGIPVPKSPGALLALREKRSFSSSVPGGVEVLVAVGGLSGGTAVIRSFVPEAVLRHGVTRAWLLLLGIGAFLLLLSVAVADQLARSLVRPLTGVALAADHLATGDLSARATVTGPLEVRRVANGLNRLAARIDDLLAHERESAADLSHRLRTPLTALRIDAERHMSVEVPAEPVIVQASREDLAACADVLLENVFTHTPEGVSFAIRLSRRASGGAWLVVADDGPGFPPGSPVRRGQSGAALPAWDWTSPGASPRHRARR